MHLRPRVNQLAIFHLTCKPKGPFIMIVRRLIHLLSHKKVNLSMNEEGMFSWRDKEACLFRMYNDISMILFL